MQIRMGPWPPEPPGSLLPLLSLTFSNLHESTTWASEGSDPRHSGEIKSTSLTPAFPPTSPDEGLPELLLADIGGSPAEVLDDFRYLHPCNAEPG